MALLYRISVLILIILSSFTVFSLSETGRSDAGVAGDLDEIEKNFLEKETVDVIVWLKDNEFTSPEYQDDLDKKREEIRKIQDKVLLGLSDEEFKLIGRFIVTNGFAGSVTKEGFEELRNNDFVAGIFMDREIVGMLAESRPLINADDVENTLGITGKGVTICAVDSGVDYTHPALGGCFGSGCKVVGGYDFVKGDGDPMDDNGHGTHVAGIAVSDNGTYRGIAPKANLAAVKVLDAAGFGGSLELASGIDWCIDNANNFNIKIITMSLGIKGAAYNSTTCPTDLDPLIQTAINADIFVDAASGNDGIMFGVTHPACILGVTSVGAVYDANIGGKNWPGVCIDSTTAPDKIACATNRGQNLDLLAPGSYITSTISSLGTNCKGNPFGGFGGCSGTSMAAPHVAGVAALLFEKNPNLLPGEIETILKNTGKPIFDSETKITFPRVDALAAVLSLNTKPLIKSVLDAPDPVNINSPIKFTVDWVDPDVGEQVKIHMCKTDDINNGQICTGGSWCDSTSFTSNNPESCTYTTTKSDIGTKDYYAFVCDDSDSCSVSATGTFKVGIQEVAGTFKSVNSVKKIKP